MSHNLPQSPVAEKALAELGEMSFEEIMTLSVLDEARDINQALMRMNQFVLDHLGQEQVIFFRHGRSKLPTYSLEGGFKISVNLISAHNHEGNFLTQVDIWQQIAA